MAQQSFRKVALAGAILTLPIVAAVMVVLLNNPRPRDPLPQAVTGPALTQAPPTPLRPPALVPHTRVDVGIATAAPEDPGVLGWAPVLFDPSRDATPPPPSGPALAADVQLAMEYRSPSHASEWERTALWWSAGAIRRWNEIARQLMATWWMNSAYSARMMALLAVAQHDAALAAHRSATHFARDTADRERLAQVGHGQFEPYSYPSVHAAIAQASVDVLRVFFPHEVAFLEQNGMAHARSRVWMGETTPSAIEAGRRLGKGAAEAALEWARNDGIDRVDEGRVSRQGNKWYSRVQVMPGFGRLRPWAMRSGDQFRAPPPPAVDSTEFAAALAEIRAYSDRLSAEQLGMAQFWNLGVGGMSVPGMWGQFALDLALEARYSEVRTARLMALLNIAMMDACIASWDTKYHYLVPRPSMLDPAIREPLGLPPHPSYTSGHSAFSGAAEGILSTFFPEAADELHRLAEEASASRWYGGIHYRFDGDAGLEQGRAVAAWVIEQRAAKDRPILQTSGRHRYR